MFEQNSNPNTCKFRYLFLAIAPFKSLHFWSEPCECCTMQYWMMPILLTLEASTKQNSANSLPQCFFFNDFSLSDILYICTHSNILLQS